MRPGKSYVIERAEGGCPHCRLAGILSGWKDIARYLGHGVRTVQRYERDLGLPVRRPSGHRAGAVVALRSELDFWVQSSPLGREPRDGSQRIRQSYLRSELAGRLQERAQLHKQMMALRKELTESVRMIRESVANLRQQLNETRKRQDSISSMINQYSRVLDTLRADLKPRKPN